MEYFNGLSMQSNQTSAVVNAKFICGSLGLDHINSVSGTVDFQFDEKRTVFQACVANQHPIRSGDIKLRGLVKSAAVAFAAITPVPARAQNEKPQKKIDATGGTIAGIASAPTITNPYKSASFSVRTSIEAVPQIRDAVMVVGEQPANLSSDAMTGLVLLKMCRSIKTICASLIWSR
jgi:hypothetical protein